MEFRELIKITYFSLYFLVKSIIRNPGNLGNIRNLFYKIGILY
jgi:hypothetical protein